MSAPIEVRNLVKTFGTVTAVDGVSFDVKRGEILGLTGPNGAGKTTLFRLLATLLPPTSGSATLNGFDVVQRTGDVRRSIGVVPLETTWELELTVEEHLLTFVALHGVPAAQRAARIADLLAVVELSPSARTPVRNLAAGMRRRADIARALVHEPPVLLLDEPTAGLEPASRAAVWALLRTIQSARGLTILLTTQELDHARTLCDRVAVLDHGRLQTSAAASQPPPSAL